MLLKHAFGIYLAATIAVIIALVVVMVHAPNSPEDYSKYPYMSFDQIISEDQALLGESGGPVKNFKEYFDVSDRTIALEYAAKRYLHEHQTGDDGHGTNFATIDRVRIVEVNDVGLIRSANENRGRYYQEKFKGEFEQAQASRDLTLYNYILSEHFPPEAVSKFLRVVTICYGMVMFMMIFVLGVRVEGAEGNLWLEFANPVFVLATIFWPVGLFLYKASPLKVQTKRALQYASYTLSAMLSFGGATLKAQTKKSDGETSTGNNPTTLTVSGAAMYLPEYLGTNGLLISPHPILQSWITIADKKSGIYGNIWQSESAVNTTPYANYGNETDVTIGWSHSFKKRSVTGQVAHYNVSPLRRVGRGDAMEENVRFDNLFPRAPASFYIFLRNLHPVSGGKPLGGQYIHIGANRSINLGKHARVDANIEAVGDSGGLGLNQAGILRIGATLAVPWRKHFELRVPFQMTKPITRVDDGRKFEQVLGVGMNFSFAH